MAHYFAHTRWLVQLAEVTGLDRSEVRARYPQEIGVVPRVGCGAVALLAPVGQE
jgi:hypothetical protein